MSLVRPLCITAGVTALVALGLALIYRSNRILNFAQADLGAVPVTLSVALIAASGLPYVLSLFIGLAAAISREDAQGQPPGGWMPEQRVSLLQAFDAFTRGAAYAGFAEGQIGSLEPGRQADFILIDRDIFNGMGQREIRETRVLETYVGGRKVWERREERR